jgi:hypothetical protein
MARRARGGWVRAWDRPRLFACAGRRANTSRAYIDLEAVPLTPMPLTAGASITGTPEFLQFSGRQVLRFNPDASFQEMQRAHVNRPASVPTHSRRPWEVAHKCLSPRRGDFRASGSSQLGADVFELRSQTCGRPSAQPGRDRRGAITLCPCGSSLVALPRRRKPIGLSWPHFVQVTTRMSVRRRRAGRRLARQRAGGRPPRWRRSPRRETSPPGRRPTGSPARARAPSESRRRG